MSQKSLRLQEIKDIIRHRKIGKQEDLLSILHRRGFEITQATLSRDLASLNIARKNTPEFGPVYFIPDENENTTGVEPDILYGARSLAFSKNLGVLKTLPGYANSAGALIDAKEIKGLLGTVAGNDTILLIIQEGYSSDDFVASLSSYFSNINSILR